MTTKLPTLFISHGSPMFALQGGRAARAWAEIGKRLPRPRAVLLASAHWETELPMLGTAQKPDTIHDFGGFPPELYKIRYPAPGAPDLGQQALSLLKESGIAASGNGCRGLDHGAWVPLLHLYPDANVPVAQISVQTSLGAEHAMAVGRALAPLAADGILLLGSGHMTHNLGEWIQYARRHGFVPADARADPYVEEFRNWVDARLRAGDLPGLARWFEQAPHAARAHPSSEHFLPLPFAFAAAGNTPQIERFDLGVDAGVLALDAYLFWPQ